MNIPKKIKIISAILSLLGLSLGTSLAAGPAGVTDAALWLDAAQLTGLTDGQIVSTWTDMSGSNNHATASSGPTYNSTYWTNVVNGQPVVRFEPSGNANFNFTRISTIRTVFWVVKNTNPGEHFLLGDADAYDFHAGNPVLWTWSNNNVLNGEARLMGSRINGTAITLPSSSFSLVSLVTTGNVQANRLSYDRWYGGRSWAGDMAEVIIYTRALSASEVLAVNTYLANKYGLAFLDQPVPNDIYWDNNGSTAGFGTAAGTWSDPTTGNGSQGWSGDVTGSTLPVDFTTAVTNTIRFGSVDDGLAAGTITVSGGVTASNLTFAAGSGAITLAGGTITLADTSTITVNNGGDTISSVLAGAANSLTKQGFGALTLSGVNTITGDVTVRQGTLMIASGVLNTSVSVIVEDGAKLQLSGWANTIANPISLSGHGPDAAGALVAEGFQITAGQITLLADSTIRKGWHHFVLDNTISGTDKNLFLRTTDGTGGMYVNGALSLGSGALSISGVAWTDLNASNSFSGGTTVDHSSGGLNINNDNALGTGGLTVNNGVVNLNTRNISIASLSGTGGSITDYNGVAGTTTLSVTQSVNTTYSGVIANGASRTVALVKAGSGTLTLRGNNSYSGATTVNAGGLIGVTGGSCLNSSVIVADGAACGVRVASWNGQWACSNLTYSAGTTTLNIDFGGSQPSATLAPLRVANDLDMGTVGISVTNGVWPTTPGTYPLVSYAGTLSGTVPASALSLPAGMSATIVNNTGSKRIDLEVSAVTWAPSSYNTWTNLVSGNASGTWGTPANWSNSIPDSVDAMADFSTLDITADGYVNIDAPRTVGQLRFRDTTASHNWYLTNAALTLAATTVQPVIDVSNQSAFINNVLKGTQGFIKQGASRLNLLTSSTMTGDVTVRQGTLIVGNGGVLNTTVGIIVEDGARMEIGGWASTIANPIFLSGKGPGGIGALHGQGNQTYSGPITLLNDSTISHDWNNFSLNGPITGTDKNLELLNYNWHNPGIAIYGSMNLGAGALTINTIDPTGGASYLGAANIYSGGTVLTNYASLGIGNAGALGSGGVTLYPNNPTAKLNLNTFSVTVGWLSGPGGIITDDGAAGTTTLTVNQSINTTFSGVITNGANRVLALVKKGSGLLTLAGTNTYTGATAVSNGTLAVSGALSSSAVTVCTGAAFAAGSTGIVGRATLGSTLTFQNSSAFLVDVAPVTADAVEVTGDVVIGTGVQVRLSGSQEKSGSWELIKTTGGTVQGSDPTLINGLHGAKLSRTTTAIVLTIPPQGTLIRVL